MALSILRPLMYFLILRLVLQNNMVPFIPVVSDRFNCESVEDNGRQVAAIPHMTITTFIGVVYLICVTQLDDSLFGVRAVVPLSCETMSYFYTLWLYTWGCVLYIYIHSCMYVNTCISN
jgi:hypothetical protein